MKKDKTPDQNLEKIGKLYEKLGQKKEDRLIDLIIEIIVSSTISEYYDSIDSQHRPTPNNEKDKYVLKFIPKEKTEKKKAFLTTDVSQRSTI